MRFTTRLLHDKFPPDAATGATTQPIFQTSAFYQSTAEDMAKIFAGRKPGFVYTRVGNPTIASFERRINALEGGVGAVACSSGMAAVTQAVLNILSQGDELVAAGGLYGGTSSIFRDLASFGITVRYAKGDKVADFAAVITEKTKLIYVETIGNPKLDVADIAGLAELAHDHEVPLFVVIHSTSKAINGNGNSIGGIVVSGGTFKWNPAKFPKLKECPFGPMSFLVRLRQRMVTDYGGCMAPFNAYLTGMGLDTLALREERINENAKQLAEFCVTNGLEVNYPGLNTSPSNELAKKQFNGHYGAMLTVKLGTKEKAFAFINALKFFLNVSNIGDARSLIIHPASTIFINSSEEEKANAGVTDDLVRINAGLEDFADLRDDIKQALQTIESMQ